LIIETVRLGPKDPSLGIVEIRYLESFGNNNIVFLAFVLPD